jgi:peptidoglycan/LPS O-acetylase OafA/YrhL
MIRGLAALSVVVWHAEGYKGRFPPALNTPGRLAVWLFFGISGYVIAYGFVHGRYRFTARELGYFYRNRFLRLYPLFLFLSLLTWATQWALTGGSALTAADIPSQLLAIQWNQQYTLLGVFWTLGIELHFYLVAPALAWLIVARHRSWPIAVMLVYGAVLYWCHYAVQARGWSWDGRNLVANLPHFLTGMAACGLTASIGPPRTRGAVACLLAGLLLLVSTNWTYHVAPATFWSPWGVLLADAIILLFVVAHSGFAAGRRTANPVLRALGFLGTVSYGVYAWHAYLMTTVPWFVDHVVIVSAASIAVAHLSYRFLERPALARKKHAALPSTETLPVAG